MSVSNTRAGRDGPCLSRPEAVIDGGRQAAFLKENAMLKATPFGSHFSTKLEGANNKLVCALSAGTTCSDDIRRPIDTFEEPILVA
jgi:hypothetical protein